MSEYELSRAINDLPDEMLQEAAQIKTSGSRYSRIRRWTAVAAVVAIFLGALLFWPRGGDNIVSMPGVVRVYACDVSNTSEAELEQYELLEDIEKSYRTTWIPGTSIAGYGAMICLNVEDEALSESEIVIEISTNFGELKRDTSYHTITHYESLLIGKWGVIDNKEVVYWSGRELSEERFSGMTKDEAFKSVGSVYVEVIIRADDHIVGYAVMEVVRADCQAFALQLVLRDSKYYPPVDGEYQNVTEEYVQEQIAAVKNG